MTNIKQLTDQYADMLDSNQKQQLLSNLRIELEGLENQLRTELMRGSTKDDFRKLNSMYAASIASIKILERLKNPYKSKEKPKT